MLRVVHISFHLDPQARPPQRLLAEWTTLVDVAAAVAHAGAQVAVLQACRTPARIEHRGVEFHFVAPEGGQDSIVAGAAFAARLEALAPDVAHVHGLGYAREVARLARLRPTLPILVQDHANRLPRPWRASRWHRGLRRARGFAFTGPANAAPFVAAGLIAADAPLFDVPESSSAFQPGDRDAARRATGIDGDPALLWIGHLNANKDPLTVLDGIAAATDPLPGLRLWCCYGDTTLLPALRRRVERDPRLAARVHLLGRVEHARVEMLMRAADLFVQGSHHEGSGYALIEALACGLPPVVTAIPSFRALTGDGRVGALWIPSDAASLRTALLAAATQPRAAARAATRTHFEREVSFDAIGRKLVAAYTSLLATAPGNVA